MNTAWAEGLTSMYIFEVPKARDSLARSEGPGIQNKRNLRPERTRSLRFDRTLRVMQWMADFQPAPVFHYLPGPADWAVEFWPFGPGATRGQKCVYSSARRAGLLNSCTFGAGNGQALGTSSPVSALWQKGHRGRRPYPDKHFAHARIIGASPPVDRRRGFIVQVKSILMSAP